MVRVQDAGSQLVARACPCPGDRTPALGGTRAGPGGKSRAAHRPTSRALPRRPNQAAASTAVSSRARRCSRRPPGVGGAHRTRTIPAGAAGVDRAGGMPVYGWRRRADARSWRTPSTRR
ncbi:hypothetical protein QJS66_02040 [Kocuria rhizophila]|nr:hypothetical protein QJS66_02040 [Kocuria rhizophila]